MDKRVTCIGGRMVRADRAAVPVSDRGFRFGDGVFETIRIERGVPYQWDLHIARLLGGLAALRITPPEIDWTDCARRLLQRNHARAGFLRIAVSRGSGSQGYMPFPAGMPANWVMEHLPPLPASAAPARLWLSSFTRPSASSLPGQHKLAQGVNSTLALLEAAEHKADDALLLTSEGHLCCAASANLFWLKGGTLFTPPFDTGCLAGTTRDAVIRLAGISIKAVHAPLAELERADAVFLTNTRYGIRPIGEIQPMGWRYAKANPILRRLIQRLRYDRASQAMRFRRDWQ